MLLGESKSNASVRRWWEHAPSFHEFTQRAVKELYSDKDLASDRIASEILAKRRWIEATDQDAPRRAEQIDQVVRICEIVLHEQFR